MSAAAGVELLTPAEVGTLLGVKPPTVARYGATGRLLASRTLGGHRRFFAVEVRALLRGEPPDAARKLALAEQERLSQVAGR